MLILASQFSTLPEGCPVRHGDRETTIAGMAALYVDLTTPAAVRAFAPALICAVKGLRWPPEHLPGVVWSRKEQAYMLLDEVTMTGLHVCAPADANELPVTGDTPEACLLAGLKAACVAVGGGS